MFVIIKYVHTVQGCGNYMVMVQTLMVLLTQVLHTRRLDHSSHLTSPSPNNASLTSVTSRLCREMSAISKENRVWKVFSEDSAETGKKYIELRSRHRIEWTLIFLPERNKFIFVGKIFVGTFRILNKC